MGTTTHTSFPSITFAAASICQPFSFNSMFRALEVELMISFNCRRWSSRSLGDSDTSLVLISLNKSFHTLWFLGGMFSRLLDVVGKQYKINKHARYFQEDVVLIDRPIPMVRDCYQCLISGTAINVLYQSCTPTSIIKLCTIYYS